MTSGGDAPGMNAALRALTRVGLAKGHQVIGVRHGYTGLIAGDMVPLSARDVGGIIGHGGTMLGTTRCLALKTEEGQRAACAMLRDQAIDALFVIGGNGSQAGAAALAARGVSVIGVGSTIDNDLVGAEPSIGVTTALDVAIEAIDRLRATASATRRAFLLEVMGRHSGYLALMAGLAGGAEIIVVPEHECDPVTIVNMLHALHEQQRSHAIVVVAEGAVWNADRLASFLASHNTLPTFETRVTKLGHVQRGGAPGVFDRLLATRLGAAAIEAFDSGQRGVLMGLQNGQIQATALEAVNQQQKSFPEPLWTLARTLAQ
jgi:6-phosphofructokinase 1